MKLRLFLVMAVAVAVAVSGLALFITRPAVRAEPEAVRAEPEEGADELPIAAELRVLKQFREQEQVQMKKIEDRLASERQAIEELRKTLQAKARRYYRMEKAVEEAGFTLKEPKRSLYEADVKPLPKPAHVPPIERFAIPPVLPFAPHPPPDMPKNDP